MTFLDSDGREGDLEKVPNVLSLLLFVHLAVAADADKALAATGLNRTHHRILFLVALKPGVTVGEIVVLLRVTAQAIQSPLRTLIDNALIRQQSSEQDKRRRNLSLTERGEAFLKVLSDAQHARIAKALASVKKGQRQNFFDIMQCMMDEEDRDWLFPSDGHVTALSGPQERTRALLSDNIAHNGSVKKGRARRP